MTPFTPAQHQMVPFLESHDSAMLAAGMGLGKTRAVIKAASNLWIDGKIKGMLIVSPLRVSQLTWPMELKRWPELRFAPVYHLKTKEGKRAWQDGRQAVYLVPFDILDKIAPFIEANPPPVDLLVWDEITKAKNPSSKRVNKFRKHRWRFTRHWGLTGTLMSEGFMEVFAPYRLIDGGERLGTVFTHFRARYFDSDYMGFKWTPKPFAKDAITKKTHDITLILRREDHLDIPPVEVVDEDVTLDRESLTTYKRMERDMLVEIANNTVKSVNSAVLVFKLLQLTSGAIYGENRETLVTHDAKIKRAVEIATENPEPIIFFTHFIHEKERLLKVIPGAVEFTPDIMDKWDAGEIPAIVANPKSVGHGLNLQKPCRRVVWITLPYSRDVYDQANARVARHGQTRPVFIHRLMVPDTIDWAVAEALRHKEKEQQMLFTIWNGLAQMRGVTLE